MTEHRPLTINQVTLDGLPALAAALGAASLPADDIDLPGRTFYRFTSPAGEVVGYGGVELYGSDALLRSIVVQPGHRRHGYGKAVVARLMAEAGAAKVKAAYLLTTSAKAFFEKAGFTVIDRAAAPAAILGTTQVAGLCPASASLLVRTLDS